MNSEEIKSNIDTYVDYIDNVIKEVVKDAALAGEIIAAIKARLIVKKY